MVGNNTYSNFFSVPAYSRLSLQPFRFCAPVVLSSKTGRLVEQAYEAPAAGDWTYAYRRLSIIHMRTVTS